MRRWNGSYLLGLRFNDLGLGFQDWGLGYLVFGLGIYLSFAICVLEFICHLLFDFGIYSNIFKSQHKNNKFNATGHK
jgi:hypothetical protein